MVGVMNNRGEVLLSNPGNWSPPGGGVRPDEHWPKAATRIIKQKTGITVEIDSPVLVEKMNFYRKRKPDDHFSAYIVHYRASVLSVNPSPGPSYKWFDTVPEKAHPNHIGHIKRYLR